MEFSLHVDTYYVYSLLLLTAEPSDYNLLLNSLEFQPAGDNQPNSSIVISIPIISDDDNEFDETFKLIIEVSNVARAFNITEGKISTTVVLIKDDDGKTRTMLVLGKIIARLNCMSCMV